MSEVLRPSEMPAARKAYRDKRRAKLAKTKMDVGCLVCGYDKNPAALHFDHRDPTTKEHHISTMMSHFRPWPLILAEMAKCDVLCANCHAEKTWPL